MPLGTLSGKPGPRMIVPVELIRELKLDIEINLNESLDYEKLNLENTTYQDSISIIIKLVNLHDSKSTLLGTNKTSKNLILEYLLWIENELIEPFKLISYMLQHRIWYNFELHFAKIIDYITEIEKKLKDFPFLTGNLITVADLYLASCVIDYVNGLTCSGRKIKHKIFINWFYRVIKTDYFSSIYDNIVLLKKPPFESIKRFRVWNISAGLIRTLKLDVNYSIDQSSGKEILQLKDFVLDEPVSIITYLVNLHNPNSTLLGSDLQSRSLVLEYLLWATKECINQFEWVCYLLEYRKSYNLKPYIEEANKKIIQLELCLTYSSYLTGKFLTVADLCVAASVYRFVTIIGGEYWRSKYKFFMKWFYDVIKSEIFIKSEYLTPFFGDLVLPTKSIFDIIKRNRKWKIKCEIHPLNILGESKIPLTVFSQVLNISFKAKTYEKEIAFEKFNKLLIDADDDWSLWKLEYKVKPITMEFIYREVITEFNIQWLRESGAYMLGRLSVYGMKNNGAIAGVFLIRGQNYEPIFNVMPGWENFKYTRLNIVEPNDMEMFKTLWWGNKFKGKVIQSSDKF